MADDIQLVIFQVGRKHLALPLDQVEHILRLGGENGEGGGISTEGGVILFQNEAIPWRPLWAPLAEGSLYQEFDELEKALPQRRQDHIDWMAALEQSLLHDVPFAKARSPYECAFGKWFYSFKSQDRRLGMLLGQFEAPHARIHGLADKLLGISANGQRDEALNQFFLEKESTLKELLGLFDALLVLLPSLKRPVALILNDQGKRTALGVDRVLDIRVVPAAEVHPSSGNLGALAPKGFITMEATHDASSSSVGGLIPLVEAIQLANLQ
ncbi:MAG: CZB domain-containing protein [Betaproteobacteria bacterium]|nr:CZB domain-containing protein [Betaproteobacteria bacterium]